jgi:hypothetical protein
LLPVLQNHRREIKNQDYLVCSSCVKEQRRTFRSQMGCGLIPGATSELVANFTPPGAFVAASVCPGYSTSLPEVIEAARLHRHWEKGTLRDRIDCDPTPLLLDLIETYDNGLSAAKAYAMTPEDQR